MQGTSQLIDRSEFSKLLTPGTTIWRPVYRGAPSDVAIFPPMNCHPNAHSQCYTLAFCPSQRVSEPIVNWYVGKGNPRGLVTFLQSHDERQIHALPDNWYALQVLRVGATGKFCFACPLVTNDMQSYLDFRAKLGEVFLDYDACKSVVMPNHHQRRVFIEPGNYPGEAGPFMVYGRWF